MKLTDKIKSKHWLSFDFISYIPLVIIASVTVAIIYLVFVQTQNILQERLRERLIAIASTAALQIDADSINQIENPEDKTKDAAKEITRKLDKIRNANENLMYIYILRKTEEENILKFVLDADTLDSLEDLDENANGIIDQDEAPPEPGDSYDISEIPDLADAFYAATADHHLNSDQWGTFLSGYAPIYNEAGTVVAVLGIDVQVDDFYMLVRATLIPFLLLAILLLAMLTLQTVSLIRIWNNRVEIIKDLDRQKDELLSIVSHQLATPISAVKWNLEMMLDGDMGKVTKEQKENLLSLQAISEDLSDLVSMILDVSRIQLGRMKMDKQVLNLNNFFEEILDVIVPKSKEKKVHLNIEIPKNLPEAMLDKRYTRMTIENLLSNAVKYTNEGGNVSIRVKIKNKTMFCEIQDTGVGIPKEDQPKIFGKLFRASNVRNSIDGNGFGLYVAKGAVEAQGGKIWFNSIENVGTTFYINLPTN